MKQKGDFINASEYRFFTDIITLINPYNFVFKVSFVLLIIGGLVGMFGSYKAVRKYLKI